MADINMGDRSRGELLVRVFSSAAFVPVVGAMIRIYTEDGKEDAENRQITDISGLSNVISLAAPLKEYSMEPGDVRPYTDYSIRVTAEGYLGKVIEGIQVLPEERAVQNVYLTPEDLPGESVEEISIPEHVLFGDYPALISEEEEGYEETGEIVLSKVVIPEYIVVHDGAPSNNGAKNYWVKYRDYIKNVASNEIYATWPEAAIYANILAIMSFTLNRVYTEWYRNKGYSFTITSSTAYDQKWVYGRNTYAKIDRLVDSVFANYISRPGLKPPVFATYCDGRKVSCKGLTQWGSKYLAEQGYRAIEILRYYYGEDVFINTATQISGVPSSYPGYELKVGSRGEKVQQLQNQLRRIAQNFPAIPRITADGIYGPKTQEAVKIYQKIFGLRETGITDYATWYSVSGVYVGVTRVSEL